MKVREIRRSCGQWEKLNVMNEPVNPPSQSNTEDVAVETEMGGDRGRRQMTVIVFLTSYFSLGAGCGPSASGRSQVGLLSSLTYNPLLYTQHSWCRKANTDSYTKCMCTFLASTIRAYSACYGTAILSQYVGISTVCWQLCKKKLTRYDWMFSVHGRGLSKWFAEQSHMYLCLKPAFSQMTSRGRLCWLEKEVQLCIGS